MIRAVITASSLALTAAASAQPTWIQTSATPTSSHLSKVVFPTPQRGFIVGANRVRLRTDDGGATWIKEQESGPGGEPWYGIVFHENGLNGFIHGNGALRTTDGGDTWLPMPTLPVGSWWEADFAGSASTAYLGANGAIVFTPDAGETWQLRSGYPHCPIIHDMDFVDDELGLVAGLRIQPWDEGMYRTADGGRTWTRVYDQVTRNIRWLSPTIAEAITADAVIRSEDAGLTWQAVAFNPEGPGIAEQVDLGDGVLVAVTTTGEILRSNDGGFFWYSVNGPLAELPDAAWSIALTPDRKLWVVGKYGFILRSEDEGLTWTQASSGMGLVMNDMKMFNDAFGVAVGGHGYVWRTTDGGRRWEVKRLLDRPVLFGQHEDLQAVDIVDEQFAVVGGAGGLLFRTWDGGAFWENIGFPSLPLPLSITDLCFTSRDNGWMIADGLLHRTTTGGWLWDPVPGVTGRKVHFHDELRGWVLAGNNTVRCTIDGGQTWTSAILPGNPLVLESMAWLDADTGWVAGRFGYCAKTVNGGLSWQLQSIGAANSLLDIAPASAAEVWAVGFDSNHNNIIMRSANGGASWTRWVYGSDSQSLDHVRIRPDGGVHIGGFFGLMLTDRFPRACTGDWDASGAVNSTDLSAYITTWLTCITTGSLAADVNNDGAVNSTDLSAFITIWLTATLQGGC